METVRKIQACFDARLGSLIIGVIMAIISGMAAVGCVGGLIYVNVLTSLGFDLDGSRPRGDSNEHHFWYEYSFCVDEVVDVLIVNAITTAVLIVSLLEFSFSVVLADGASKRMTGHLKAYFIYGHVRTAALLVASIVLFYPGLLWDKTPGYLTLFFCGVNIVVTAIVYMAYKNIMKSVKGYSRLDNEVSERH